MGGKLTKEPHEDSQSRLNMPIRERDLPHQMT